MAQRLRLKAAVCTGVLAASMATPTVESAFASSPALPDVSSALTTAGVTSGDVSSILSELNTLQRVAPGGSLGLLSLSTLDNSVTTLNGSLLGSLPTPVLTLLAALNPAAPTSLTQTLADLQQIGAARGASTAVQQAVSELSAALTTAGLSQLLSQLSGLTSGQNTSALSARAGLQSLPLGGSVPGGSLAPIATVLSTLAGQGGVSLPTATLLNSAASTLNGSGAISPAALLGVIGQLQSCAARPRATAPAGRRFWSTKAPSSSPTRRQVLGRHEQDDHAARAGDRRPRPSRPPRRHAEGADADRPPSGPPRR